MFQSTYIIITVLCTRKTNFLFNESLCLELGIDLTGSEKLLYDVLFSLGLGRNVSAGVEVLCEIYNCKQHRLYSINLLINYINYQREESVSK